MNHKYIAFSLMMSASLTTLANPITKAEARLVAASLVGIDDHSGDDVPLAPYYIFSRGEGKGFVIASGDDGTAPILGYTEQGDYDADLMPPQLQAMLSLWGERIAEVQKKPQTTTHRMSAPRRAIADYKKGWASVTPLLKTHWHQDYPYNMLAPEKQGKGRCMTGCVATAGAQVTYYFHKDNPTELAYDTPTYGYGTPITVSLPKGTPIEWDQMKLSGRGTARQDSAVARLMYALGTSAWLTYGDGDGLATSGHNNKMAEAMKGQFALNYSFKSKSEYTQQKWEELIYENLASKRPMLYSGVHPESGGHSVCLDGYQANTGLYHFNFGWGGQGDGYYTVDDKTGMNGFNTYQDLVFNITPQKQNLTAEIYTHELFHKATTNIEATIANNGTLDYNGLYMYINKRPFISGTVVAKDTETIIEPGKSTTLTFAVNTTIADSAYVILADKGRHVVAMQMMKITPTVADLHLNGISVDASSETTTTDGIGFRHVNNTTAIVSVNLTNGEKGSFCQPNMQCFLQKYDAATKTWTSFKDIIQNTYTFAPGQTQNVDFVFTGLSDGGQYRAYINDKAVASKQSNIQIDTDSQYVCFVTFKPNLDIAFSGRQAKVTGRWNASVFKQKAADASVCSYDISGVTGINEKPKATNPNALFYTTAENTQLAGIENVVVGDACQRLKVQTGHDFKPQSPFTAREAQLVLADAEPGKWHTALIPFAAEVPYGMQMKQAKDYVTQGIATINHEVTRRVEAMSIATYLTSQRQLNTISATDAVVTTDTVASFFDGILNASTLTTELQSGSLVPDQYLTSLYYIAPQGGQTTLDAFMPAVTGAKAQRVRTTSETLADGYYRLLSQTINAAYDTLDAHPTAKATAVNALKAEIATAQDLFTYRSHAEDTDISNERDVLAEAIKEFVKASEKERVGDVNGDDTVDVADIATIISVMATAAGGDADKTADVNGDGTVDVADIATVISVMAGIGQ